MIDPQKAKKGTILFTLGIFFNLLVSAIFFTGAYFLTDKANENRHEIAELSKEKGLYVIEKVYTLFKGTSGDVRDDDPKIVAQQNLYDALHYDISLAFDLTNKSISGEWYMKANSLNDTLSVIYINLYDNMNVSGVTFANMTKLSNIYEDVRDIPNMRDVAYARDKNYIIVNLNEAVRTGENFVIKVNYSGKPVQKGFDSFSFKELYGNMTIYNLSEPNWAPVWWPCKDLPDDKATTNMRLRCPNGMTGVSNGLLKDREVNEDGTVIYHWGTNYPIATYLVSIVVTKFSYWEDSYTSLDGTTKMPVVYYAFPKDSSKARVDWEDTPEMIRLFSEKFGEYPFIDEKYGMAEFGWTSGAMEHQTLTSMGYLLQSGDKRYDYVVAHELAHQWFGDAVTLKDWKNIWLNEGFASYSEALWKEHKGGMDAYFSHMKSFDYGFFSGTVYDPPGFIDNPAIYATIYHKGAWVLHMLRGVLGDEAFFNAVKAYYERYKFGNAETSQLQEVFEEFYGSKLDWFFDQWVYKGTGRPKYEYSWKFEDFQEQKGSGVYTVRLLLKQVQKNDIEVYKMPVKITVSADSGDKEFSVFNDNREQTFNLTVDSAPKEVYIDKNGWILKKVAKGSYEK